MKWSEVREHYPTRWVLVEAIVASSQKNKRTIDEMSVISDYQDTKAAWQAYKNHHLSDPARELYMLFTAHETLEIQEQSFIGIRGLQ